MSNICFIWDPKKAVINLRKHGISFEEAKTVFYDEEALLREDPDHSKEEDRFILLGRSSYSNMLVVCHCFRQGGDVIRIISARKATKREDRAYWGKNEKRI